MEPYNEFEITKDTRSKRYVTTNFKKTSNAKIELDMYYKLEKKKE